LSSSLNLAAAMCAVWVLRATFPRCCDQSSAVRKDGWRSCLGLPRRGGVTVGVWVVQFDRSKLSFGRGILYSNAWKMLTSSRSVAAQPGRLLGVGESSGFLLGSQTEFCGSPQPLCDDQSGAVARRYCRTVGCHLDSSGRQGVSTESVAVQRGRSFGTGRTFGFSVGLPGRVLPAVRR
jgi:hypothetical protein